MIARLARVALALLVTGAAVAAFAIGRGSVDDSPPTLPAATLTPQRTTAIGPTIVLPPRAVVPR
jgi:hypothetical protein